MGSGERLFHQRSQRGKGQSRLPARESSRRLLIAEYGCVYIKMHPERKKLF